MNSVLLEAALLRFPGQCSGIIDVMGNPTVSAAQSYVLMHLGLIQ